MGQNAAHPAFSCQFLTFNQRKKYYSHNLRCNNQREPAAGHQLTAAGAQDSRRRFFLLPSRYTIPSPKREVFSFTNSVSPFQTTEAHRVKQLPPGTPLSEKQPSFPGLDPYSSCKFLDHFCCQRLCDKEKQLYPDLSIIMIPKPKIQISLFCLLFQCFLL